MNANITESNNTTMLKAPLTNAEREKLSAALIGWGKLAAARRATKLSENTLKRAEYGFDVMPDTAAVIRKFLTSLS